MTRLRGNEPRAQGGRNAAVESTAGCAKRAVKREELAPVDGMEDLQALLGTLRQSNHASPSSAQRGEDIFADQLGGTSSLTVHKLTPAN
jgi:hypothetical protein